jgi:RHS repeat-associated protein
MFRILFRLLPVVFLANLSLSLSAQEEVGYYNPAYKVNYVRTWKAAAPLSDAATLKAALLRNVQQATKYFNGMGWPVQMVARQQSLPAGGTAADLVVSIKYDAFGRARLNFLPFAANNAGNNNSITDGGFKLNPTQQLTAFGQSQYPGETWLYAETMYEPSVLNRVTYSLPPGNSWAGAGRGTASHHRFNMPADEVKIWRVTEQADGTGTYNVIGDYASGQLYKTLTIDEHGKQLIEFRDKEGQVVLKKTQLSAPADNGNGSIHSGWLCTYYIYDDLNRLRCVIQPEGVKRLSNGGWQFTTGLLYEQCFRYEYDQRKRMISKKAPGADPVYMVYDKRGRQVMVQDGNMRKPGLEKWLVTLYDELNRPVQTGLWSNNQSLQYHTTSTESNSNYFYPFNEATLPAIGWEMLTQYHYDNYNGLPAGLTGDIINSGYGIFLNAPATDYPEPLIRANAVMGRITWVKVKVLEENKYISSCSIYDDKGRIIQVQSINYTGALDVITNQYNFAGNLLRSHLHHLKGGSNPQTIDMATKNIYDDLGRLSSIEKNINNSGWKAVNSMTYDALGQLKTRKLSPALNDNTGLETLTYEYNIRGWLLGANREYAKDPNSTTNYFGFDLGYDKQPIAQIGSYAGPQYNGNISGMVWKSRGDNQVRKYDYAYDPANRLTGADFNQYNGAFNKTAGIDFSVSNLSYDANGNILSKTQKGLKGNTSVEIDNMTYRYYGNSNRLLNVLDAANDPQTALGDFRSSQTYMTELGGNKTGNETDYDYDANGNLKFDNNKDIASITYNHLNLPRLITIKNNKGSIEYVYSALGNKLKKIVHETGKPDKATLYLFGIYEDDALQYLQQEEGRIRPVRDGNGSITAFTYDYFLNDHLGNVRVLLTEEQKQNIYPAATLEGDINNGSSAVNKEQLYYNINAGNIVDKSVAWSITDYENNNGNPPYNNNPNSNTTALSGKLYKLDATAPVGLGITLKVMAGDKLNIFGKSYYYQQGAPPARVDVPLAVADLLNMFVNSAPLQGKGITSNSLMNGVPGLTTALSNYINDHTDGGTGKPRAYINWVLFDEQFRFVSGGFDPLGNANIVKTHNNSTIPTIPVTKNGYIYIYCSNETQSQAVFFDNLQVIQTAGPILEETHYYPFGLTMAGISSRAMSFGEPENKYKFNGIEQTTELDLNQYDAFYRSLDPQTGRWWQIDPKPTLNESPYAAMGNNPVINNDRLGDTLDFPKATTTFKNQFDEATTYLVAHKVGGLFHEASSKIDGTIHVVELTEGASYYDPETKTIHWNPTGGVSVDNAILSPATVLNHELDHAVDHIKNPKANEERADKNSPKGKDAQYGTKEERRVIQGTEQKTARALGEIPKGFVTRTNHEGYVYPTSGPTTTQSSIEETLRKDRELKKSFKLKKGQKP